MNTFLRSGLSKLVIFVLVLSATLTWRLQPTLAQNPLDCCPNNCGSNCDSYRTCSKHSADQCGSGNVCIVCNCDIFTRVTVNTNCYSPHICQGHVPGDIIDFATRTDSSNWITGNCSTGDACQTGTLLSQTATQSVTAVQDNYCTAACPYSCSVCGSGCAGACADN
jgi:hypothetical protein